MAFSTFIGYIVTWVYNCKIRRVICNLSIESCTLYLRKYAVSDFVIFKERPIIILAKIIGLNKKERV
jgi:hypothetical protein